MEIVCAGYPKTASKSCSNALRVLGYNVADWVETAGFLSNEWTDFVDGKTTIDPVIAKYKQNGFQVNQDIPTNFYWEDLYNASPNCKVILTVRDSSAQWKRSWTNFMRQEYSRAGNPGFWITRKMLMSEMLGPKLRQMDELAGRMIQKFISPGHDHFRTFYTWQGQWSYIESVCENMEDVYQNHIENVKQKVPADRLLIWNVKDGWEPLCKFLGKPIPNMPIPHDNITGDLKFIENYLENTIIQDEINSYAKWNFAKFAIFGIATGAALYQYKTGRFNFGSILTFAVKHASKLSPIVDPLGIKIG